MNEAYGEETRVKRRGRIVISAVLIVLLLALGGGAAYVWTQFGDRISLAMGWTTNDYEGEGHGEVLITITEGEIGSDIANALAEADVVKTSEAFYELLLAQDPAVDFQVGTYQLRMQMSAQAALDALQNEENRMRYTVTIPEGTAALDALELAAGVMGIPFEEFEQAVQDPTAFGVPADFPSIEGFLFPATYTFEPGDTAESIIQTMVDRMWTALGEHGVSPEQSWEILTLASIVQREAGSNFEDFPKVSRVFLNRLDIDMLLQSDATVGYGTGNYGTVWTSDEERQDTSNPYNTYANPGLPIGPIGLPGDVAIEAAIHPADGPWLYFVTVDLSVGTTEFATTLEEHEANVQKLAEWCTTHRDEGGTYCD
ncbi:endolytic transglycosylase MltG [Leucobacter denitrificans]|uniref:Endolytic murein transglycosylase n=1 Tax=Leucobacter denitrificans TaxID=683042 RepID=A0A7G9S5I3_9MICO|nr:endolytic transglycosylase MltG [Leucobacter denitrificans]QNN63108.1 endolytic transglycosylase MltG [Leucobacter denitrificans]